MLGVLGGMRACVLNTTQFANPRGSSCGKKRARPATNHALAACFDVERIMRQGSQRAGCPAHRGCKIVQCHGMTR